MINKVDRADARPHEVLDEVFSLFIELDASDNQLDFPIVYASGKQGIATLDLDEEGKDMRPILDTILHRVLPPASDSRRSCRASTGGCCERLRPALQGGTGPA